RHRVRLRVARPQPRERAEQAAGLADVRRLEPQIEVVVRTRVVALLALAIGQPAHRVQVWRLEQPDAVIEGQALAGLDLRGDVGEPEGLKTALHYFEVPMTWSRSVRARGPSSSAIRIRCHCPSTTSPPLT